MTTDIQVPSYDLGHPMIQEVPAVLSTEVVNGATGQLTIRIPNTTVTVLLVKDDLLHWADQIRAEHAKMTGIILPG